MRFLRYWLFALGFCLAILAMRPAAAQSAPASGTNAQPSTAQPAAQAYALPPDKLAKAIALNRIRNILDIAGSIWDVVFLWLLLATRAAASLEVWTCRIFRRRWLQGLLFFAVFLVLITLADLPLDLYGQHVSRAYSISVQGWPGWFADAAKSLGLTLLIGAPVLLLFNWIVGRWPRRYWLAAWLVTLPLMVLSVAGEPLIEPLFNHYEPLTKSHADLVAELERVVARTGTHIPPERMFLMDASAKSNGLNAYVTGLGSTKRIVVWDTTAGRIPDDEIMFIFGHESGHYVLNHIPKMLAIGGTGLFFIYWACAGIAARLGRRFGARWRLQAQGQSASGPAALSTRAGFVVLIFTVSLAGFILTPVINGMSRHFEHEADVYGQEAVHGLVPDPQKTAVAAFNALGEAWLEDPDPNPFIEFWLYDHPSVKNRANFAAHYDPWADGGHGEYFDR
ncbi:MAG TPA: M48 family metallopeptidase [Terracidiphilus sp.]|jgi:Zn-dependent protease with chaperone function